MRSALDRLSADVDEAEQDEQRAVSRRDLAILEVLYAGRPAGLGTVRI